MKLRLTRLLLLLTALLSLFPAAPALAQEIDPGLRAQTLLARLSPEERVGQLFIVSFQGNSIDPDSPIYDLIVNHHIGGVTLTAASNNFQNGENAALNAYTLNSALQQTEWDASIAPVESAKPHTYIPLLLAVSQEGGGLPNDQILSGLTPLPDQMALGATWNANLAEQTGQVMGRELAALGFNLYLGLSLDVLSNPNPALSADLGTRAFGGDPYWVSQMGSAYLRGLRQGSAQRLAVIAKHFPGRGGADRPPEQEISTVRRSLDELKQIDLAPFLAVTGSAADSAARADGLLVSHIRYQGLQGNIRATTRPVSFDAQALNLILTLPELASWRQNGGLIMSDDLGTAAVRRFYDPSGSNFSARLVARDAFLAGNDLLFTGNLVSSETETPHDTLVKVLDYFTQKYTEDPAFALRVDEAALRVLTLKARLYPAFNIQQVIPLTPQGLGAGADVVFSTARQAATLLSPSQADLATVLPEPPSNSDYLVFFTDTRLALQCAACPAQSTLPTDAFQKAILSLYGPNAAGLVLNSHLNSFNFDDLALFLNGESPTPDLANALNRASWVILSTLDLGEKLPQTQTLRRFLSEQQSILLNKRVLLFSFSAPYYLDATDIASLTAYYGLYSDAPPFIDLAARLLFQEVSPVGAAPISVPGIGYDLNTALSPAPGQIIPLALDLPQAVLPNDKTLEPTPAPAYRVGDDLALRTGLIYDHNNHPVPDGTVVQFIVSQTESELTQVLEATTTGGIARAAFRLNEAGTLNIRAVSEPASLSAVIQLKVDAEGSTIIIVTPTPVLKETPLPTPVITPAPTEISSPFVQSHGYPSFSGWFTLQLLLLGISALAGWLAGQFWSPRWALRFGLILALSGLAAYAYLILELPGAAQWVEASGMAAFLQSILLAQGVGALAAWQWKRGSSEQ